METFPTYYEGRNLLQLRGKRRSYKGTIPRLGPLALLDIDRVRRRLRKLAGGVSAEAPWSAARAEELDSQTLDTWIARRTRTKRARAVLEVAVGTVMGTSSAEQSLLSMLSYVSSAGSFDALIDTEGGAQQDRFLGGSQEISIKLAAGLGDAVVLETPVHGIAQDGAGVVVEAEGLTARAQRAIVAVPPPLAARIAFSPSLGGQRDQLQQRMAGGALTKCAAVYPEPFWRERGLTGQAVSDAGPISTTFDNSPPDGSPGVMLGFISGPEAIRHARRPEAERRRVVLDCFVRLFGEEAAHPGIYLERAWAEEEWSRGGPGLLARARRAERLRRGAAAAVRPDPLGRRRDRDDLVRLHGRGGALGRAGGGGGARRRGLALIVGRMEVNELSEARDIDVAFAGAARQAEMVRAKEVSPRELVELYLERIGRIDPGLNAYRTVFGERALAEADEAGKRLGSSERGAAARGAGRDQGQHRLRGRDHRPRDRRLWGARRRGRPRGQEAARGRRDRDREDESA